MVGGDRSSGLLVRRLLRVEEATDVQIVAEELTLEREFRSLFVHKEQVLLDARGEPVLIAWDTICAGPFVCASPALAVWLQGTCIPFGAAMEYAIGSDGKVRAPALVASALAPALPLAEDGDPAPTLVTLCSPSPPQVYKLPPPTQHDLPAAAQYLLCKDQLDIVGGREAVLDATIRSSVGKTKEAPHTLP